MLSFLLADSWSGGAAADSEGNLEQRKGARLRV
jgi:hypothetical protein